MVSTRSNDRLMLNGPLKSMGATTPVKKLKKNRSHSSHTFVQTMCENNVYYRCFHFNRSKLHDFKQSLDALNRSSHENKHTNLNGSHEGAPKSVSCWLPKPKVVELMT